MSVRIRFTNLADNEIELDATADEIVLEHGGDYPNQTADEILASYIRDFIDDPFCDNIPLMFEKIVDDVVVETSRHHV